ncbi:MAG TPA: TetR family transcriptional regulator [Dermatophilaceae bacterium]|nr:TetR family transcriptional regulator [Dermatophilaceae bacterium]
MASSTRERLTEAAFALFAERGFEQTTVDEIAERAGVGRTTFFRQFGSKEEVVFPDHPVLLEAIAARLATSTDETAIVAVTEAVRLVLLHYLAEGELARRRYALTSRAPALRDREIASAAQYQRLFREYVAGWMARTCPGVTDIQLRAELMSAAVVAAHNHVLRRWLRADTGDPLGEVDDAMRQVIALFSPPAGMPPTGGTTVVAFRTETGLDAVVRSLRELLARDPARP